MAKKEHDFPARFKIVTNEGELDQLISYCKETGYASIDFETSSTEFFSRDEYPLCLGVAFQPGSAWIIPLGHFESPFKSTYPRIMRKFSREVLEDKEIVKIGWNVKFETKWLFRYGCDMVGRIFDGMLAKHLLDEERPHNLKDMVARFIPDYAGYEDEVKIAVRKYRTWAAVPLDILAHYNALDVDLTFKLMLHFEQRLIKHDFYKLFRSMYMPRSYTLAESEYKGIRVDTDYLENLDKKYEKKIRSVKKALHKLPKVKRFKKIKRVEKKQGLISSLKSEIRQIRKEDKPNATRLIKNREDKIARIRSNNLTDKEKYEFNFSSPAQLSELFFTHPRGLRLPVVKYTTDKYKRETDNPSTDEDSLKKLKVHDKSGLIDKLLELRELSKLHSTYIKGIKSLVDSEGRVHTTFHLWGTVTGRLSSTEPNLQNIPRDTTAADIKKMFIPPPGHVLLEVDYSQAELRIVAEWANEKTMLEWFKVGKNIHVASACRANKCEERYDEIFKITKDESHPEHVFWTKRKKRAKTINFGILYEQSPMKLKETLEADGEKVTVEQAEKYMKEWFKDFPRIKKYIENQHKFVKKHGYVKTMFGQKRRLPNIFSPNYGLMLQAQRQSSNTPIQGTAAQFGTMAAIIVNQRVKRSMIPYIEQEIYNVHDSTGFYVKLDNLKELIPKLIEIYADPETEKYFGFKLKKVKMQVNAEVGPSWGEIVGYKESEDYKHFIRKS